MKDAAMIKDAMVDLVEEFDRVGRWMKRLQEHNTGARNAVLADARYARASEMFNVNDRGCRCVGGVPRSSQM